LPEARVAVALVPCQFAAGNEPEVAASFGPDHVTTPAEYLRSLAAGSVPGGLAEPGAGPGAVVGLGGSVGAPVTLGRRLGFPAFRYSFEPYWHSGLELLLLPDEKVRDRALRRG